MNLLSAQKRYGARSQPHLSLHQPLVELLTTEEDAALGELVARDLVLGNNLLEGLGRPPEVRGSLLGIHPLVKRHAVEIAGRPC